LAWNPAPLADMAELVDALDLGSSDDTKTTRKIKQLNRS
jgi:hypothetical protein